MYDKEIGVLHINPGAAGYYGWQKVRTLTGLIWTTDSPQIWK